MARNENINHKEGGMIMKNYKCVIHEDYKTGIWDNCDLVVEYNHKADRYRVTYDYVNWRNNSGSLSTKKYYMGGEIGRRCIKRHALTIHRDKYAPLDIWMK